MDLTGMTLHERLERFGFFVTDEKFGGWDNANRMIIDAKGYPMGFMTPTQCWVMVKKLEDEFKIKD